MATVSNWFFPDDESQEPDPLKEKAFLFSSEPIVGWRAFHWGRTEDTGQLFDLAAQAPASENPFAWARQERLMALARGAAWPERQPMEAICDRSRDHQIVQRGCGCGLWAMKSKEAAVVVANAYGSRIVARVALWGRFIEHESGWRAQYGYPQQIVVLGPEGSKWAPVLAERIGELYGVPGEAYTPPLVKKTSAKPKPPSSLVPQSTDFWQLLTSGMIAYPATTTWVSWDPGKK